MKILKKLKTATGLTGDFIIIRYYDTINRAEYTIIIKNGCVRKKFKMVRGVCTKLI